VTTTRRKIVGPLLSTALLLALIVGMMGATGACDDDPAPRCTKNNTCTCVAPAVCNETCGGDGKGCFFVCRGEASCSYDCPGGGCNIRCENNASCRATCAGGGCVMECAGAKSCELDCVGNRCTEKCERTESCKMTGCNEACGLVCGGAVTCNSTCTALQGGCATSP
jgi:hypothetical protein